MSNFERLMIELKEELLKLSQTLVSAHERQRDEEDLREEIGNVIFARKEAEAAVERQLLTVKF